MNRQRRVQFCGRRRGNEAACSGSVDLMNGMRLQCARNNFINKIDVTKAESATTESMTSKEYKDGKSSDNVPWIDEEKCAEGMVPMVRKDQRKGENVDEEYENLSEVVNMKHNGIDGSCHFTCQVFPFTF